ncbi:MAG: pyridoxamine 5'-phosphate oxidase family protein [Nitrospiraceae bacterium]|nr:MAG: pyridoxamine 5'-phosphate oxidase family protein [Nitrospiraceae bacterium]
MKLSLKDYFASASGTGVLSTADAGGRVDSAIYSRPHVNDDGSLFFLMRDRLTYHNLQLNPHAAYLFIENSGGYRGVRLFLKKTGEDSDPDLIAGMTRRHLTAKEDTAKGPKFLVRFAVEKILPLIGSGNAPVHR